MPGTPRGTPGLRSDLERFLGLFVDLVGGTWAEGRCTRMGFSHFGTPGKGSRLHGSAFQGFAEFAVP